VRNLVILLGGRGSYHRPLDPVGYGIIAIAARPTSHLQGRADRAEAAQYYHVPKAQYSMTGSPPWTKFAPQSPPHHPAHLIATANRRKTALLAWPTFARQAPINAAGILVAERMVASPRLLLTEVGHGLGALVLAVAAYFAFAVLPRVLDRSASRDRQRQARRQHQVLTRP
jgi:hypothetical protein